MHAYRAPLLVVLALALPGIAFAEPPKVVRTVPADRADAVDPLTGFLRVEFDQDMDRRWFSWIKFGSAFPVTAGAPQWADARTCLLPVKLEPARAYAIGINSATHIGFRTVDGVAATPHVFAFRTKGNAPGPEPVREKNAESIRQLREAIDKRYSYRDLRKVDWPKEFTTHEAELHDAWTADEFAGRLTRMLAVAQDEHISVQNSGVTTMTWNGKVAENYLMTTLPRVVPAWKYLNPSVATGKFADGIGYILVTTWGPAESRSGSLDAMNDHANAKSLIIDVRPNMGGNETHGAQLAARFLTQPSVYAKHRFRNPTLPSGFTEVQSRTLQTVPEAIRYSGRVAVLIGPMNVSSNESFILMTKQGPNVKLIGQRTCGSSGNPQPVKLANDVTVLLPSWQAFFPDGSLLEDKGIEPDITVQTKPGDFKERDPVIDRALEWLRKGA